MLRGIQVELQGVLAGQNVQAGCIPLTVELITHGKNNNTYQGSQQHPRHIPFLLTRSVHKMQGILQIFSFNSYYTHYEKKNKMTMRDFMKNV